LKERFTGGMLGLALGDALGAPYEGGLVERLTWQAIGLSRPGTLRYTDDTEMAVGLAESLLACGGFDADHLARTWAARASGDRGYGGGALAVLKLIHQGVAWQDANRRVFPDGSFGNGGAMRALPIGLYYCNDPERLTTVARQASEITHAHELGIEGGLAIARAVSAAVNGAGSDEWLNAIAADDLDEQYRDRLALAREWLAGPSPPPLREVAARLGNSVLAHESAMTAIYMAARNLEHGFETLMTEVIELGGDVDTIGAMAGGILGTALGDSALPQSR
jgi:poly(ADP-ribose) glycohydrolase ARH3